jgi:hypothetical protein
MALRAASTSLDMSPRSGYDDHIGYANYNANLLLIMAEALASQQQRIEELEARLPKSKRPK